MGIHNSSYLSIVWRVANHNMKAFVTICALMAGSASAESQHMVSFSQPLAIPANPLTPYSVYSPPLHPVSFGNLQVPQVPLQVEPLSYKLPLVTKVPLPVERMTYRLEHPLNTLLGHRFIKREAEPETSYVIKSKVDNPEDGTKYALDVQIDKNGHGHSHQQIERQGAVAPLRDNYLMDLNVNDQRRRDQIRRAQNVLEQMMRERNDQGQMDQMRQMDQRQMDQMENRQMDQRQMGRTMHRDRLSNQRIRDQEQMDSRMYSRMGQKSQMENGRMEQRNQRNQNGMRQISRMEMQMQSRRMTKREAEPSFEYNIAAEHPSAQTEYGMGHDMVNRVYQNKMGVMDQRMSNQMMMDQDKMDSMRYSTMGQNTMGMMEQRMVNAGMKQMDRNLLSQMDNMMIRDNQMQSPRIVKREADGSLAYTVSISHPSEQLRHENQHITYQMPYVNYSLMRTILQGHPDGGVSYLGPSMTMPYPMTPVNMKAGSRVVVQKDGQGYAVQTRA